jgi:hypothetical protein
MGSIEKASLCNRTETTSVCWTQLSTFHLKMDTEFSLRNAVLLVRGGWIMPRIVIDIFISCNVIMKNRLEQNSNSGTLRCWKGNRVTL